MAEVKDSLRFAGGVVLKRSTGTYGEVSPMLGCWHDHDDDRREIAMADSRLAAGRWKWAVEICACRSAWH
ncbi:MAG TPA: hypothetical protein VMK12_32940 [Anaeromyxobacteraceae bacterium]|nr:hypothetical protein [Anaeromyxobacteraceae bacterium]